MSSDDKVVSRTGGVELVADQGDDGSFEIRVERQADASTSTEPIPVVETGAWRAAATSKNEVVGPSGHRQIWIGAGVASLVLIVGVVWLLNAPSQLSGNRPKTVEVSSAPQFRGYMVEGQSPTRASNLRLDSAPLKSAEDAFGYDQNLQPDMEEELPRDSGVVLSPAPGSPENSARGFEVSAEEEAPRRMNHYERHRDSRERLTEILGEHVDQHRARNDERGTGDEQAAEVVEEFVYEGEEYDEDEGEEDYAPYEE